MRRCRGKGAASERSTSSAAPPRPFSDAEIALLKTFADQAVIAIQNARLFNETQEALEQQTATAEVLQVISSSVEDTAPVFEKILDSCERLFGTEHLGIVVVRDDGLVHPVAIRGSIVKTMTRTLPLPADKSFTGRAIRERRIVQINDIETLAESSAWARETVDQVGRFSAAWVPMVWEDRGIGSIMVVRQPPSPFTEKDEALLRTFADQAVIAIQNARLFNETKEALQRQTATAGIFRAMSGSPTDVRPVFDAIGERSVDAAARACPHRVPFDGEQLHLSRTRTASDPDRTTCCRLVPERLRMRRSSRSDELRTGCSAINVPDAEVRRAALRQVATMEDALPIPTTAAPARRHGACRCSAAARGCVGVIVAWPDPGRRRSGRSICCKTFADQAVIAIENVRLFNETKDALARQTATSDVLQVISESPTDVQPVFDIIAERAAALTGARYCTVTRFDGQQCAIGRTVRRQ